MNYIVKSGDSLSKIARDVLGDITLWVAIAKLNKISKVNKIYPGQVLSLDVIKPVTVIDISSPAPKTPGSNAGTEWVIGLSVAAVALVAYSKSKNKKKH